MYNVLLHSKVKNDHVIFSVSDELIAHYEKHPEFDEYDEYADHQLQNFWDEFHKILFSQYPDFTNEFSVNELIDEMA